MTLFSLPKEILEQTLHLLSVRDLQQISWTSAGLRQIVLDPIFVEAHLRSRLGETPKNAQIFDRDCQMIPSRAYRYLGECMRLRGSLAQPFRPIPFPFFPSNLGTSRRLFICSQKDLVYVWSGSEWWTLHHSTACQGIRVCRQPLRAFSFVEPLLCGRIAVCHYRFSRKIVLWKIGRSPRFLARLEMAESPNHICWMQDAHTLCLVDSQGWHLVSLREGSLISGTLPGPARLVVSILWKGRPAVATAGENRVSILSLKGDGRLHRVHRYWANRRVTGVTWDQESDRLILSRGRRIQIVNCALGCQVGVCKLPRSYLEHKIYPLPGSLLLLLNEQSQALLFANRSCVGEISLNTDEPIESLHLWRERGNWRLFASGPYGRYPQILS